MWKHIKEQFMTKDIEYKERTDKEYYKAFYNVNKLYDAIEKDDTDMILNCILLGGIDVNIRFRMNDKKRDPNDIFLLSLAILQYSFDAVDLLIKLGADTNIEIIFTGNDTINVNAANLERMQGICDKYGIKYKTTDIYGKLENG